MALPRAATCAAAILAAALAGGFILAGAALAVAHVVEGVTRAVDSL